MAERKIEIVIGGNGKGATKMFRDVAGEGSKLGGSLKSLAGLAAGAFAGVQIGSFFKGAFEEAQEARKVTALTEQVIKSTGGAARVSADDVGRLSEALSVKAGIDDEVIQNGSNLLLTFTKVRNEVGKGNDIFDQATASALDMSVALGQDMKSSAMLVGKALNDPVKGMTALTRSGVSFTQQQKDQVKAMVAAGDTLGAQKLILAEMNTQFGGAAAAAADPMQKLGVIVGNLKERIGTAFLPVVDKAATWLGNHLPRALDFLSRAFAPVIENVQMAIRLFTMAFTDPDVTSGGWHGTVERLGVAVRGLFEDMKPVAAFIVDNWKPILIGLGIAFLALVSPIAVVVGALVFAYAKFEWFRDGIAKVIDFVTRAWAKYRDSIIQVLRQIGETAKSYLGALRALFDTAVKVIAELWERFGATLLEKLRIALDAVIDIVKGALTFLSGVFDLIKAVLTGKWGEAWEAVKKILSGAWELIGGILRLGLAAITLAIEAFKTTVSMVWSAVWNGLKTLLSDAWTGLKGIIGMSLQWVVDQITAVPGKLARAGAGMFDFIKDAFRDAINFVIRGWNRLEFKIPGFDPPGPGPKFGGFTLGMPNIPLLAKGVRNWGGGMAIVGDAGPELVDLPRSSDVIPNGQWALGSRGGNTYQVLLQQQPGQEIDERALLRALKRLERIHGGVPVRVRTAG